MRARIKRRSGICLRKHLQPLLALVFAILLSRFKLNPNNVGAICYLFRVNFGFIFMHTLVITYFPHSGRLLLKAASKLCTRRFPHRQSLSYNFKTVCQHFFASFTNCYICKIDFFNFQNASFIFRLYQWCPAVSKRYQPVSNFQPLLAPV